MPDNTPRSQVYDIEPFMRTPWARACAGSVLVLLALFLLAKTISEFKSMAYIGAGVAATNTISVSGEGDAMATPDIATFSFSAVGRSATAADAQTAATKQGNAAIEYLKGQGIAEADIQTADYSISPQYENTQIQCLSYPCPQPSPKISGYEARQSMTVKVRDTNKAGALLAGITASGVSDISGIQLSVDKPEAIEAQARDKAIAQARSKAETLAKSLGVHLVRVVGFSENGAQPMYAMKAQSAAGNAVDMAVPTPSIPVGQNKITSDVSVTYEDPVGFLGNSVPGCYTLRMETRTEVQEREQKILAAAYATQPELFAQQPIVEDNEYLGRLGIYIPGKEAFPQGYLKLWPQDFIVEEVDVSGLLHTVAYKNVYVPGTPISGEGGTIYATLVKYGLSTLEAVGDLAKQLGCSRDAIQFAGIKDKDALTAQAISIRHVPPEHLDRISSAHFFLKDVRRGKGALGKGQLRENRFTILMRTPHPLSEEAARKAADRVAHASKFGFYNYYYLQRFSTPRLINFYWGYYILRGEYERALRHVFFEESPTELPYFRALRAQARERWGNWNELAELFAPFSTILINENEIARYLAGHPGDMRGALAAVSEQVTMWVYALSSWLFNLKIASYLKQGIEPPPKLPLLLSNESSDLAVYESSLRDLQIWPPDFRNLKLLKGLSIAHREVPTMGRVAIHDIRGVPEGIVLRFSLDKGQYATTFLSHVCNLLSGIPPAQLPSQPVDIQYIFGEQNTGTLQYFKSVMRSKMQNQFEELLERGS